jgi:glycolate oxidase FAD binding subunit
VTVAAESVHLALAATVGESHVVSEPTACAALAVGGRVPQYIVAPPTAESVAAVLKFAADHDLAVIPRGNGTKLALGSPPRRYDLALSLKALNHVWHYEPADLTISVEAGMRLGDLQDFLGREGLWLPLNPLGGASASIGGILATNSAGPLRLRFGSARDMVLGIKVATTEGKLIKSGGRVVKNVAGYDLCKLLVGSYGTLGVIVEASFKLFPRPASRATWVLEPGTLGLARDLRRRILNSPLEPLCLVLLNTAASGVLRNGPRSVESHVIPAKAGIQLAGLGPRPSTSSGQTWRGGDEGLPLTSMDGPQSQGRSGEAQGLELWIEVGGSPRILDRHAKDLAEMGRSMGVPSRPVNQQTAESCWVRLRNYEQLFAHSFPEVMVLKATLPIANSEEFLSFAQQVAEGEEVKMAGFAQVGVGIVHLGLWGVKLGTVADRLVTNARKAAASLGGALVVEHYPNGFNGERDVWGPPGDPLEAMRRLKAAWDPKGILSPGRFVGGL